MAKPPEGPPTSAGAKPSKPPLPPKKERLDSVDLIEVEEPRPKSTLATVVGVPALDPKPTPQPDPPATREPPVQKSGTVKMETLKLEPVKPEPVKAEPAKPTATGTIVGMPTPLGPAPDARQAPSEPPAPVPSKPPVALDDQPGARRAPSDLVGVGRRWIGELIRGPRPRLIAFAVAAALVVFVFFGVLIRLVSGPRTDGASAPASAFASTAPPPPATDSAPPPVLPTPVAAPPPPASCTLSADSKVVAPHALLAAGVEAVARGDEIALGFASGPKEASIATLDVAAATPKSVKKQAAPGLVKRVTPGTDKAAVDAESKTDPIHARRAVGPYDVGSSNGNLVWSARNSSAGKALWKLEADASEKAGVEAIRGVATKDGIAVVYRHNGAIWAGAAGANADGTSLDAKSTPVRVAGLGPQLGSPAIAVSDQGMLVAWADRASATEGWGVRTFVWRPGGDAPKPVQFAAPTGGPGENAMSPSVTPLANGSFLLVWTEGPMSGQQVRAQVLSPDGVPSGNAMTVSPSGVHAGQGQAAVLADGRGVIAFLASTGVNAFEVRAASIQCK